MSDFTGRSRVARGVFVFVFVFVCMCVGGCVSFINMIRIWAVGCPVRS